MELYKYTSVQNGINILTNLEIRFTQPNALNDVFDMFPHLLSDISEEVIELSFKDLESGGIIEELWENALDEFYSSMAKKFPYIFGKKEVADKFLKKLFNENYLKGRSISELIFQFIKDNPDDFKIRLMHQFIAIINSNVGVLSLSELNSDIKLWGNYADSHTGIVICFDKSHSFLRDAQQAIYVEDRVELSLNDIILKKPNSDIKDLFYMKSKDWKYEKEYRKFGFFSIAKRKLERNDSLGYPIYLFDVPKEAITGIILGSKIRNEDMEEIRSIITQKDLDIYVKQACISDKDFKIFIND